MVKFLNEHQNNVFVCPVCGHENSNENMYEDWINCYFNGGISIKCKECNTAYTVECECHPQRTAVHRQGQEDLLLNVEKRR